MLVDRTTESEALASSDAADSRIRSAGKPSADRLRESSAAGLPSVLDASDDGFTVGKFGLEIVEEARGSLAEEEVVFGGGESGASGT
jgi:hypothetical protein